MTGADGDPRVAALGRENERLSRRVARAEALTRELHTMVGELADQITALAEAEHDNGEDEQQQVLPSWLAVDDDEAARALLADLCDWIGRVYRHYPGGALPSCWLWHPAAVEELLWLRHAHRTAYEGRAASWRDIGDWHDRQRPGVTRRLAEALRSCELSRHLEGDDRAKATPAVPLTAHTGQIAQAWTAHRTTPAPTDQQLSDAAQHDTTTHRSSRR